MSFADVTAVEPIAAGRFAADVDPGWTIGGKPNGGYLLAILGNAVKARSGPVHPHALAASATYLHVPDPARVEIEVETLRVGRGASQHRARLTQGGRTCIEALFTNGRLEPSEPYWSRVDGPDLPPLEQCVAATATSPTGLAVPLFDAVEVRLDPATAGFAQGRPGGAGELRGWLTVPGAEALDELVLLFAVDSFPPATFEVALTGWVPTLALSAYVRALPAPGPLRVRSSAGHVEAQRVDETHLVWDSAGRLVATATQLAGVRLG